MAPHRLSWSSFGGEAMKGSIVDLSKKNLPKNVSVEICIIGSGSGGATAARILAEAGHDVVVLEEGGDYTGTQLTQRDGEMYDQLYMDRAGRMDKDLSITILQGRVLGGGGVINASDVVPIPEGVLQFWQDKHLLTDFTVENLKPHLKQTLRDLSASRIRPDQVNLANRLLEKGSKKLGYRGEVMMHNRVNCSGFGTCLIGCPLNAKKNPRFVAIPLAMKAGARFFTRARAVRISNPTSELKTVRIHALDSKGYHEKKAFEIRAKIVILAANAINSTQLLLRSGIGNKHVGRYVSLQPQLPIMALFKEKVNGFRGIPQSYAVTQFEEEHNEKYGLWGFRVEGVMGTPGIVSTMIPSPGIIGKKVMTSYGHMAASLLLGPDEPTSRITLSSSKRPVIHFEHAENHKQRMREAIKVAVRSYLEVGAAEVMVPVMPPIIIRSNADLRQVDTLAFAPATAPFISAHQQGGVRFGPSYKTGASDPDGRVYGTKDVYVFDSSGFPSSSSSHTMTPIMTISRFLTNRLLSRITP